MTTAPYSGGGAYVWDPATGGSGGGSDVESAAGAWSVPIGSVVGDLIYPTAAFTGALADASGLGTSPAMGVIIAKPTAVTATVAYFGEVSVFAGLVVGNDYFLSEVAGQITNVAPVAPGSVVQRVGLAINATTILFDPEQVTVVN